MFSKTLRNTVTGAALGAAALLPMTQANAAEYQIDSKGQHAFIQFKISHLGYSYVLGTFDASGDFRSTHSNASSETPKVGFGLRERTVLQRKTKRCPRMFFASADI